MAQTLTSVRQTVGEMLNPRSWFTDVWSIQATVTDMDAAAATTIGVFTLTVKGLALGDMVLGISVNADLDDGANQAHLSANVSAANTLTVFLHADEAEYAADDLNGKTLRVLVGRPNW